MDKKGKKIVRRPVSKMYASQAATKNLAITKPPAVTTPSASEAPKKEPIFIDLTADRESEGMERWRSFERKVNQIFWNRLNAGNPLLLNESPPSTTSGSSTDEEFLKASAEVRASDISFVDSCSGGSSSSH